MLVYLHGTPIWRPENSVTIWNLLWLSRRLIISTELLEAYVPMRILRSSTQFLPLSPKNLKTYVSRAFSICAPRLWNILPLEIRKCDSIDTFKRKLKTHLFKSRHIFVSFYLYNSIIITVYIFFNKFDRSLVSRTSITRKFKMLWFPNEARY